MSLSWLFHTFDALLLRKHPLIFVIWMDIHKWHDELFQHWLEFCSSEGMDYFTLSVMDHVLDFWIYVTCMHFVYWEVFSFFFHFSELSILFWTTFRGVRSAFAAFPHMLWFILRCSSSFVGFYESNLQNREDS